MQFRIILICWSIFLIAKSSRLFLINLKIQAFLNLKILHYELRIESYIKYKAII